MGNYYVLTGQGQTKSWGYLVIDKFLGNNSLFNFNGWTQRGTDKINLIGRADSKYFPSHDYWSPNGRDVLLFDSLRELRSFCKGNGFKAVKPTPLPCKTPNLILQLVKAGALFQSAEVVFTKTIPQNIIDNLKKNNIHWSIIQAGSSDFQTLKVFI